MKKVLCAILAALIVLLMFTACSNNPAPEEPTTINTEGFPEIVAGVIKGKSPQDEVLYGPEIHFPENGYKLVYKEYDNGEQALKALENGEIDFSLLATKHEYNKYGSDALLYLGPVYFHPMAIYLRTWDEVSDIKNCAKIAIPDDAENMARALLLLAENGYITLKEGAGLNATLADIEKNEKEYEIIPVAHKMIASSDADIFVMGSLEASAAGLERRFDAVVSEKADSDSAVEYATGLIIRAEDYGTPKMELTKKYFFTRRMYNAIDGSTDTIIDPMFDLK